MYKLKKNLQILPPNLPDEPLKIINPENGNSFLVDQKQLEILRLISQMSIGEASDKLKIKENQIESFVQKLLKQDFLDELDTKKITTNIVPQAEIELKPDLDFAQDGDYLTVKDPKSDKVFPFTFNEAYLLHRLNETSLQSIAKETNSSEAQIQAFIQNLMEKDLLIRPILKEKENSKDKDPKTLSKLIPWNLLGFLFHKVEFKNIDQFLELLNKKLGWLWNWPLAGLPLAIIVFGLFLVVEQWPKIKNYGFPQVFGSVWLNILLGLVLMALIFSVHNLVKGLALNSRGQTVKQSHILYTGGLPWFHLDISNAFQLNSRWQKLIVIGSGILFELWLISFNIVLWSLTPPNEVLTSLYHFIICLSFCNLIIDLVFLAKNYIYLKKFKNKLNT